MHLRIGHLYPDGLNSYGDRGNVLVLKRRCEWRGIAVEVVPLGPGPTPAILTCDIILFGCGSDEGHASIRRDLTREKAEHLCEAVENEVVLVAVGGGYQLLGQYYRTADGAELPGLGLLAMHTTAGSTRAVGNVVATMTAVGGTVGTTNGTGGPGPIRLVGYENHHGRTYLQPGCQPLATVHTGFGNNGQDRTEGAVYRNCFGTYLHGPLLPKNPDFADHLIALALQRRYGTVALAPLDDTLEHRARDKIVRLFGGRHGRRR